MQFERLIDKKTDSLRFYFLGANGERRVERARAKPAADFGGLLIV